MSFCKPIVNDDKTYCALCLAEYDHNTEQPPDCDKDNKLMMIGRLLDEKMVLDGRLNGIYAMLS
jgi:hypothetical protein